MGIVTKYMAPRAIHIGNEDATLGLMAHEEMAATAIRSAARDLAAYLPTIPWQGNDYREIARERPATPGVPHHKYPSRQATDAEHYGIYVPQALFDLLDQFGDAGEVAAAAFLEHRQAEHVRRDDKPPVAEPYGVFRP